MSKINIIVIDDDPIYRDVLTRSLSRLNCQVEHFAHPQAAMPSIKKMSDLYVVLDLKLENDSGLRWITAIRASNPSCHLILLTGYASISTAVEAIKLGANDYLAKPITARGILEHIKQQDAGQETAINEKPLSVERLQWEHIQKVLADNQGNVSAAARALGMHRRTLQRKLAKRPVRE